MVVQGQVPACERQYGFCCAVRSCLFSVWSFFFGNVFSVPKETVFLWCAAMKWHVLLLHCYWVACGVSEKARCRIPWPLLCGKAGSIQENGGESVTNLWTVGTGLLSQLKGQGDGGVFCFTCVCAHILVAFEGLLTFCPACHRRWIRCAF